MATDSILKSKSYDFALTVIKATKDMRKNYNEFDLTRQFVRSGTAVGALIREAEFAQSKADFVHKLSISLKEANETGYWISLLKDSDYLNQKDFEKLHDHCNQLIRMLVSSIKTAKSK